MNSAGIASPEGGNKVSEATAFDEALRYPDANFSTSRIHKNCAEDLGRFPSESLIQRRFIIKLGKMCIQPIIFDNRVRRVLLERGE